VVCVLQPTSPMSEEEPRVEDLSPQDAWMAEQIVKAEQVKADQVEVEVEVEDWQLYECSVTAD
jgi:hypothetical protein